VTRPNRTCRSALAKSGPSFSTPGARCATDPKLINNADRDLFARKLRGAARCQNGDGQGFSSLSGISILPNDRREEDLGFRRGVQLSILLFHVSLVAYGNGGARWAVGDIWLVVSQSWS
jgi:hypothetical protein